MGVIFNEAEAVWEWLMTHLIVINLLFSIIIIFFQRRDPRSVWTWLFALNFIPVFGIIFYLLFGQDLKKSRMFKVKGISDRLNMPVKSQEEIIRSSDIPEEMMDPLIRRTHLPSLRKHSKQSSPSPHRRKGKDAGPRGTGKAPSTGDRHGSVSYNARSPP